MTALTRSASKLSAAKRKLEAVSETPAKSPKRLFAASTAVHNEGPLVTAELINETIKEVFPGDLASKHVSFYMV